MLSDNLIKMFERSFRENSELVALKDYFKSDRFTYLELAREVAKLHMLFKKMGVERGDKIALVGRNNPRWCLSYIATVTYGAVIVPILQDFSSNDIIHIVKHSKSRLIFMGDNIWDMMDGDQIANVEAVFSLTDFHAIYERDGEEVTSFIENIDAHFTAAYSGGFGVTDISYPEISNDSVCLLNYTSGTTGSSKGVILTINNLTGNLLIAMNYINPDTDEPYFTRGGRVISFLPLAHAYGCAFDFLTQLAVGGEITLLGRIPTPKILLEAMSKIKPTIVCCVPLILEKVYRKQVQPMLETTPMSLAMKIPLVNSAIYSVIKSKLIDAFGGEVKIFIVGGAPLNSETEAFLMKIGFPITVGYGMTECAPLISFVGHDRFKATSCGRALREHLEVRIDSADPMNIAGEILVRGEHVMKGYYKNEKDTASAIDTDGWLHTGDMGVIDSDDMIYIRGRCKTMILSASGQNIYPEQIEERLNNMYMVSESLIIENEGRLAALVVPDFDQAEVEGVGKERFPEIMEQNLKELNAQVASYEKVASITIYPTEFIKTPKRSIKRYLYNTSLLNSVRS
ncbi:MAG: AMP-binding protein [Rikenellaceae bacterium]